MLSFVAVSQATLLFGSTFRQASRTASETWSQILSGWPQVSDKRNLSILPLLAWLCLKRLNLSADLSPSPSFTDSEEKRKVRAVRAFFCAGSAMAVCESGMGRTQNCQKLHRACARNVEELQDNIAVITNKTCDSRIVYGLWGGPPRTRHVFSWVIEIVREPPEPKSR